MVDELSTPSPSRGLVPIAFRFIEMGPYKIDTESNSVTRGGKELSLRAGLELKPLSVRILIRLIERRGQIVRPSDVQDLLTQNETDRLRDFINHVSISRRCLAAKDFDFDKYVRNVAKSKDKHRKGGFEFIGSVKYFNGPESRSTQLSDARVHVLREPETQSATGADSASVFDGKGLVLSLDGIIPNSVGELLFDRVDAEVIRECHASYDRSLGDFAFAVVYGSQLRSKWHPESSLSQSNSKANKEPGALIISLLPNGLYAFEPLDEDLRNGALLRDDGDRRQVCEYIGYMAQSLRDPFVVGLCRDLLIREAEKFLGVDASLFQKVRHYRERRFGKDYYRHDLVEEIPALLGKPALATLVGFLPKGPQKDSGGKSKDKYERSALIQFVSEVVLTHITTMYEFEKSSQRQQTWRMPYALRAEITRKLSLTQQQRLLRRTVVRHALRYALRETSGDDRKADIISMLVAMRRIEPFMEIREMLSELVVLEADEGKEGRALKLNRDIRNAGYRGGLGHSDSFSTARNSILRELAKESQLDDEYRSLLWRLFPALEPRPREGFSGR